MILFMYASKNRDIARLGSRVSVFQNFLIHIETRLAPSRANTLTSTRSPRTDTLPVSYYRVEVIVYGARGSVIG
jgi:hypothetical protein